MQQRMFPTGIVVFILTAINIILFSFGVAYGIGVEYKKWLAGISGKSMCLGQDDEGFEAKEHNLVLTLGVTYRF